MKILGKTSAGYVVDINEEELRLLTGAAPPNMYCSDAATVGQTLDVREVWSCISPILVGVKALGETAARLQALADLLREQPKRLEALLSPMNNKENSK